MVGKIKSRRTLLLVLTAFNSLFYVAGATFSPYINVYYKSNGLSVSQIGILSACGTLVALVMQPVWGIIADKWKKRVKVLRISIVCTAVMVSSYYLAGNFTGFLLCSLVYTMFNCAVGPLGDTVVIETACKNDFPYSRIRMGGTVSYAIAVVLAGIYLKSKPEASFGITAMVLLAMLLVTCFMADSYGGGIKRQENNLHISVILKSRGIIFVLFFCCMFQAVLGCYSTFLSILVTDLGYANNVVGILFCVSAVSEIPVLLVIDKLLKKYQTEYIMLMAGIAMVVRIMLPAVGGNIISILIAQAMQGMTYMVMYYCTVMYINNHLSQEMHGTGQALLCAVQTGAASLFSNALGGFLGERIGIARTYKWYGSIFFFIILFCYIFISLYRIHEKAARNPY